MGGTVIKAGAQVRHCIIAENVVIGENAVVGEALSEGGKGVATIGAGVILETMQRLVQMQWSARM